MGTAEDYDQVLKGKYPARAHAKKVAEWILANGGDKTGTIYLEAQKAKLLEVSFWSGCEKLLFDNADSSSI
jgi:Xaa-Pro dipeptidase